MESARCALTGLLVHLTACAFCVRALGSLLVSRCHGTGAVKPPSFGPRASARGLRSLPWGRRSSRVPLSSSRRRTIFNTVLAAGSCRAHAPGAAETCTLMTAKRKRVICSTLSAHRQWWGKGCESCNSRRRPTAQSIALTGALSSPSNPSSSSKTSLTPKLSCGSVCSIHARPAPSWRRGRRDRSSLMAPVASAACL